MLRVLVTADELVRAWRERMAAAVRTMRGRDGEPAASAHVRLFAREEAARGNTERAAERRAEDARLTARVLPDLQLDKSTREPAPWYARPAATSSVAVAAAAAPPLQLAAAPAADADDARRRERRERRERRRDEKRERKRSRRERDDDRGDDDRAALERLREERRERERREQQRARALLATGRDPQRRS